MSYRSQACIKSIGGVNLSEQERRVSNLSSENKYTTERKIGFVARAVEMCFRGERILMGENSHEEIEIQWNSERKGMMPRGRMRAGRKSVGFRGILIGPGCH